MKKEEGTRHLARDSSLEREVSSSNLGPVKSDTVLPSTRHRCEISSNKALLPVHNGAELGPANSLYASAYYSEYNERFDLMYSTVYWHFLFFLLESTVILWATFSSKRTIRNK